MVDNFQLKMEKFIFKAKNWQGKSVKGIVEAKGRKEAIRLLKERDLVILTLIVLKKNILDQFKAFLMMRVSLGQLAGFTRQLATMVNAGLPVAGALNLLKEQTGGKMSLIVTEALAKVEAGEPLGKSLEKERKIFGDVFIASVKAGEEGGVLDKVLLRLADNLEKKKEFLGKVKGAMIYPVIVIIGMIGVTFVMMIFVVPKMTSLYGEFGTQMPLSTRVLISMANFTSANALILPLIIVGFFVGLKLFTRSKKGRLKFDEIKLKLLIIGPLLKAILLTEITRTLSTLLGTGVPLVDSLKIVGDAAGNEVFKQGLQRASERVEKGLPLSDAIAENPFFPMIVSQLISTGEQTGTMDTVLGNISDYFEAESEEKVKGLTSAIEPLIMIVLGVGVGFLVIAIIMPIYNLTSQF